LDEGRLPIERGFQLTDDDVLRRQIIMTLMCSMPLNYEHIRLQHGIDFSSYFQSELQQLAQFEEAGLLSRDENSLRMTPKGRLFVRAIGMVFDKYLGRPTVSTYSKLI